ncbi:MAG TPA: RnfABCDGE type electron transport complex subunit B [Thermoanaerobaculaceae bacterium]|nr:RnfABCDGE type electron transport complex subunit B [Thermoanaerobaculaceae bacterium]HRS15973.1 RnfABCDGE type electron transport complex subunit B [Thermoanaerobaculaceae bacterium]
MLTTTTVLTAAGTMLVLGLAMCAVLGWASRAFHVAVDPRVEAASAALPGANCGGCGYVGCNEYAEAVVKGADVSLCPVGGASVAAALAEIMGIEVKETAPRRPVVHCAANHSQRLGRHEYKGEQTCAAANLVAGVQGCVYGCLGLGDCVRACEYDAIHIVDGLATVDYVKCIGCSACARVCPRNIITMIPFKADQVLVVKCSNRDMGKDVTNVCKVGCIGCRSCTRLMGEVFNFDRNLPSINYDAYTASLDMSKVLEKCPMASLVWVGKPTPKHLEQTAGEVLPERIEADFKTTADQAEWRG